MKRFACRFWRLGVGVALAALVLFQGTSAGQEQPPALLCVICCLDNTQPGPAQGECIAHCINGEQGLCPLPPPVPSP